MECLKVSKKWIFGCLLCGYVGVTFTYWMFDGSLNSNRNPEPAERWNDSVKNRHITSKIKQSYPGGSPHWKIKELRTLEKLVQHRLSYLQNPKNCGAARKVLCRPTGDGFGSVLHHLTFCLIVAYATQRTLIIESKGWRYARQGGWETMFLPLSTNCRSTMTHTVHVTRDLRNITHIKVIALQRMQSLPYLPTYLPLAIPDDLADKIIRVHRNPLWWIGQFVNHLIRPNQDMQYYLRQSRKKLAFKRLIVGMHIRRIDKWIEAEYHQLEEYMEHVNKWFNQHEKKVSNLRYVYLATDNPDVLKEARNKYLNYTFINANTSIAANTSSRYTETSLREFLVDVHILSMCDFVVCTMSSNVGRLVFELMQARDGEASRRLISLDSDYYFYHKLFSKNIVQEFKQNDSSELHMKGYYLVNDRRSNPSRPIFTRDNKRNRVAMPVYAKVKKLDARH